LGTRLRLEHGPEPLCELGKVDAGKGLVGREHDPKVAVMNLFEGLNRSVDEAPCLPS